MIRIMRKDVARLQRENDRLKAQLLNDARPFTAVKTFRVGEVIADGARVYIASDVIIAGETVRPGDNCTETTIAEVLNQLREGE